MKAQTRYTINLDGTIEKWWLEKDLGSEIALRKVQNPKKWNNGLHIFPKEIVFENRKIANKKLKTNE